MNVALTNDEIKEHPLPAMQREDGVPKAIEHEDSGPNFGQTSDVGHFRCEELEIGTA
jgi:hypothetical protein